MIVLKELRESKAELTYIKYMNYFETRKVLPLITESDELISILVATTKTLKERMNKK